MHEFWENEASQSTEYWSLLESLQADTTEICQAIIVSQLADYLLQLINLSQSEPVSPIVLTIVNRLMELPNEKVEFHWMFRGS